MLPIFVQDFFGASRCVRLLVEQGEMLPNFLIKNSGFSSTWNCGFAGGEMLPIFAHEFWGGI